MQNVYVPNQYTSAAIGFSPMSRGGFQLVTADNTLQVTSLGLSPVIEVETCIDDNTCLQNVWAQHTCTSHAWTAAHCGAWGGHIGRCCPVTCNSCPPKENRFETNAGTGGWGGTCTCPDGQQYEVGDEMNGCGSLACTGGTSGTCTRAGGAWSRNKVTCGPATGHLVCKVETPAAAGGFAAIPADIAADEASSFPCHIWQHKPGFQLVSSRSQALHTLTASFVCREIACHCLVSNQCYLRTASHLWFQCVQPVHHSPHQSTQHRERAFNCFRTKWIMGHKQSTPSIRSACSSTRLLKIFLRQIKF